MERLEVAEISLINCQVALYTKAVRAVSAERMSAAGPRRSQAVSSDECDGLWASHGAGGLLRSSHLLSFPGPLWLAWNTLEQWQAGRQEQCGAAGQSCEERAGGDRARHRQVGWTRSIQCRETELLTKPTLHAASFFLFRLFDFHFFLLIQCIVYFKYV